ncbi:MAG: endonuclease/exonuclease/phosphatase family protein [Rhodobacteraceae bacterium]|nr:endonuclease/exonuclease/phosphatase family protein [Paracoccaceae bacterium]
MPYYYHLRYKIDSSAQRLRAVRNLKKLRAQLDQAVPAKDAEDTLLLATWNIRDLDKSNRRGFGDRMPETWFYIAEVLSRYDFVAVQEINRLGEWEEIMDILGHDYAYICSDQTDTAIGGNGERLMFVFDKRKVTFQNIAGEIVLPNSMLISTAAEQNDDDTLNQGKQFRRTPYVCRFQSGWFKFSICTAHIYYGSESGDKLRQRVQEIDSLVDYFSGRADAELTYDRAMILLGDFNVVKPDHATMDALKQKGFVVPEVLQLRSNFNQDKYYDQMAFKTKPDVIEFVEGAGADGLPNAGIVKLFDEIMTEADADEYAGDAVLSSNGKNKSGDELRKYYQSWKTYQFSDHFPLWTRIHVNASQGYLDGLEAELLGS